MNALSRVAPPPGPPPAHARRRRAARGGTFGVLDIGSTKIVCLIARIETDGEPRVLGFGWQRARGVKAGNIVDLAEAEAAIRAAVGQAEEMADTRLSGALVNLSCGQPESRLQHIQWQLGGRAVTEPDLRAILNESRRRAAQGGGQGADQGDPRETVHAVPVGFSVDATPGALDPRGMVCETLSARIHTIDAAQASLRNLGACLLRCDLEVEELVSAPLAAGLATLVSDEIELGAVVVDMGGGTTTLAAFADGHLLHTAGLPIGGFHVTNDLARLLSTPLAHAERLKTLHGGVQGAPEDDREWLPVPLVGEAEDQIARIPRAMVVGIIRPRLEETFELLRDRLEGAGLGAEMGRRVVLTGGASQLVGVRELAARVLDRQVRLGRPGIVRGLPESASGPAFAAPVGLLLWAAGEGRPAFDLGPAEQRRGAFRRLVDWLGSRA